MAGYLGAVTVGLDVTSVDVEGDITSTDTSPEVTLQNTTEEDTDGGRESKITFKGEQSGGEITTLAQIQASHDGTADDEKGDLIFSTNDGADGNTPTERMRIDADGNVGIGTNAPSAGMHILADVNPTLKLDRGSANSTNANLYYNGTLTGQISAANADFQISAAGASTPMSFYTNGTERMKITTDKVQFNVDAKVDADNSHDLGSGGARWKDLYISKIDIGGGSTIDGSYAYLKSSSPSNTSLTLRKDSAAADAVDYLQCRTDANGLTLVIEGDGDVKNLNNSYGATSDQKLKENISDSGSQWDDIKAVRVRKYSFIDDNLDVPNQLGVIAQELEASGMNGLVSERADVDENFNDLGTVTKTVKYSVLYMKAVKALQEAMDRIETLETKVAALESA